ncbi:MAG: hypothetical protein DRN66_04135 [Candidatus Nanohalarchaeota archaeon]|nr:MAG: hypothetical protein DRN66_04135 [Candidatus Nanohaloarchaeota archaeon]
MKVKKSRRTKAQVNVDSIIAFVLFMGAVVLIIVYANHSSNFATLKNQEMFKTASMVIKDRFENQLEEEVCMYPVGISNFSSKIPVELFYNFSFENATANSTAILDSEFNPVACDIESSTVIFNAQKSQNPYFLIAIPDNFNGNKTPLSYETDLNNGTDYANNTHVYVEFKNTGIGSIRFHDDEILFGDGCLLSTSSFDGITGGFARIKGNFNSQKSAKIYQNNSLVLISSPNSFDSNTTFINYTYFYNGSENIFNISYGGTVWNGTADMIDLYNGNDGVAIIGKNMTVEIITNKTYWRRVKISSASKYKIIPHYGNYTEGIKLKNRYLHDANASLGPKRKITGATDERINSTLQIDYIELKKQLGLSGADMNITFSGKNESFGKAIPENKGVFVFNYPIVFVDRYANKTLSLMRFSIWRSVD